MDEVAVVIGVRGFGLPCARRLGKGRRLLLGDVDDKTLASNTELLKREGYEVTGRRFDICDKAAIAACADTASGMGKLQNLVLTAGLSPRMASAERIFEVNMLGTIDVLETFLPLVEKGTVGVMIASNAAYFAPLSAELERLMAMGEPEELMAKVREVEGADTGLGAYWLSKRANQLRVQAAAPIWGKRGGRIISVSPGIMSTEMAQFERESGTSIDATAAATSLGRIGNPDEIAAAIEWLSSPEAGYITGTDLLIDGGFIAAYRWGNLQMEDPQDASTQAARSHSDV